MSYIINDLVELNKTEKVFLDTGEEVEKKIAITKDQFYSNQSKNSNVQRNVTSDSRNLSTTTSGKRYFGVLSTSDKEINNRIYDYESWKKTVTDGTWVGNPYAKPILRHHDLYSGDSVGRIKDSFFYDNVTGTTVSSSGEKIPSSVLTYFKDKKCFDYGTGTVIVEFNPDEYTADRIQRGLDVTLSQSSVMKKLTCSICDNDYFGGNCGHFAGKTYEFERDGVTKTSKCLVKAFDYSPIELSFVNHPANDVSIVYVMEESSSSNSKDSQSNFEAKIDENQELSKNNTEHATDNKKVEVPSLFKKIAKDHFISEIVEKFNDTQEMKEAFDTMFETLAEDQVEVFSNFLKNLEAKVVTKDQEVTEVQEATEVQEVQETTEVQEATEVQEVQEATEAQEVTETQDSTEATEVTEDKSSVNKEKNLKDVFSSTNELKSTTVQDKEILAYLKNYEF